MIWDDVDERRVLECIGLYRCREQSSTSALTTLSTEECGRRCPRAYFPSASACRHFLGVMAEGLAEYAECKSGPAIACWLPAFASILLEAENQTNQANQTVISNRVCVMFKLLSFGRHATSNDHTEGLDVVGRRFLQRRKRIVIYRDTKLMTFDDILIPQVHQNPIRIRCPRPALHFF